MDKELIQRFAVTYLQERASSFLKRIDFGKTGWAIDHARSLLSLARNPYLLTCLIILHQSSPNAELPSNTGSLFRRLAEFLWNRELIRQTRGWIPFVEAESRFAALGFKMIEDEMPTNVPRHYVKGILEGEDIIHCGVSASILDLTGDQIRFYHQLMQEYFAAVQLYRMGSGHLPDQLEPKWSEVVIALCGIADNPESTVLEAARADPYLAGRCVESGIAVSDETRKRIFAELIQEHESWLEAYKRQELQKRPEMSSRDHMLIEDQIDHSWSLYGANPSELLSNLLSMISDLRRYRYGSVHETGSRQVDKKQC